MRIFRRKETPASKEKAGVKKPTKNFRYQSLAQGLPCRFQWYNLSPNRAPTTDKLNFVRIL